MNKRKLLSVALASCVTLSNVALPATAIEIIERPLDMNSSDYSVPVTNSITTEVAELIAQLFVNDCLDSHLCPAWSHNSTVGTCTPLYDENGDVSAYSFIIVTDQDETGYVVVSAYNDIENIILEFSDEAKPIYSNFNNPIGNQIVYTAPLTYFEDIGDGLLRSQNNDIINKSQLTNQFAEMRSPENVPDDYSASTFSGYPINDPISHANSNYQGPFSAYEWANPFEENGTLKILNQGDAPKNPETGKIYSEACVPIAIANTIAIYGKYHNLISIPNTTALQAVLAKVINYGIDQDYYWVDEGTVTRVDIYMNEAFDLYNISANSREIMPSYNNIKTQIDNSMPFVIDIASFDPYSKYASHDVCGFAYTRLKSSTTGAYKSYVKVADGQYNIARYIDIAALSDATLYTIQ